MVVMVMMMVHHAFLRLTFQPSDVGLHASDGGSFVVGDVLDGFALGLPHLFFVVNGRLLFIRV